MNKPIPTIVLIVLGLIIFAIGATVGVFFQMAKDVPQINKAKDAILRLTSKAIPSIVAYGQITKIEGKDLTVFFNGESATVRISDNAVVTSFNTNDKGAPSQQNITFNDIKQGQMVSINAKILPDGQLQGESVMIIPSVNNIR